MSDATAGLRREFLEGRPSFVKTPTAHIAYQVFGEGPALVLVHGWPLNRLTWRNLLPLLAPRYRVYAIDVPGAGETEWTDKTDFSWPGQAASLKAFIDGLGLSRYYLLGQDSGAAISRMLALKDGSRIAKFAMTNTEMPKHRPRPLTLLRACLAPRRLGDFQLLHFLETEWLLTSLFGFGGSFNDKTLILGDFRKYIIRPLTASPQKIEGHRRFIRGWDWDLLDRMATDVHPKITMPVLLAWGALDRTFPLKRARRMAGQFPHARIQEIPGAKLFVHEEQPERLAQALAAFFV